MRLGLVGAVQGTGRARRGNAVAADQRVGEDEDLAAVRRVGERLDVAGHPGVEDHLAADGPRRPEGAAGHLRAVLEQELHRYGSVHARTSDRAKQSVGCGTEPPATRYGREIGVLRKTAPAPTAPGWRLSLQAAATALSEGSS